MGVYGNYEREKERERERRETKTTKDVWTDGTEGLRRVRRLIEYTVKKDYSMEYEQRLLVEYQELITRNYKEKNTNGQEC
jgi:hypothetical protein